LHRVVVGGKQVGHLLIELVEVTGSTKSPQVIGRY